jgi:hypothetical protein
MLNSIVKNRVFLSSTLRLPQRAWDKKALLLLLLSSTLRNKKAQKHILSIHKFKHISYQAYGYATWQLTS